jgi:CheY-like chemotaxis protein
MASRARVLIIDDDADYKASVQPLLEAEGYEVFTAASGKEGIRKIAECLPDVIVLDVMMESSTEGYVVSQTVKFQMEQHAVGDIPILMVSSIEMSPDELFPRAEEVGMIRPDAYMTKPLDFERFLKTIDKLVSRRVRA